MENKKTLYVALALIVGVVVGYMFSVQGVRNVDQGAATLSSKVAQDGLVVSNKTADPEGELLVKNLFNERMESLKNSKINILPETENIKKAQQDIKLNGNPNARSANPVIYAPFPNQITVTDNNNTVDYHVILNVFSGSNDFTFVHNFLMRNDVNLPSIPFLRINDSSAGYDSNVKLRATGNWSGYINSMSVSSNVVVNGSVAEIPANEVGTLEFTYNIPKEEIFSGLYSFRIDKYYDYHHNFGEIPVQNVFLRSSYVDGKNNVPIFTLVNSHSQSNIYPVGMFTPLVVSKKNSLYGLGFGNANQITVHSSNCLSPGMTFQAKGINDGALQRLELGNIFQIRLFPGKICHTVMDIENLDTGIISAGRSVLSIAQ